MVWEDSQRRCADRVYRRAARLSEHTMQGDVVRLFPDMKFWVGDGRAHFGKECDERRAPLHERTLSREKRVVERTQQLKRNGEVAFGEPMAYVRARRALAKARTTPICDSCLRSLLDAFLLDGDPTYDALIPLKPSRRLVLS